MSELAGIAAAPRDISSAAQLRAGEAKVASLKQARKMNSEQIDKTAEDFEAVFISQMLEHMFADVKTDENFGGGQAEEVYRSMMIDQYGKLMARTGGIGVADHVKRELLKMQEVE